MMQNEEQPTYEPLSDEVLQKIDADTARQNNMVTGVEPAEQQPSTPQTSTQPEQPKQETKPQPEEPKKEEESSDDQFIPQLMEGSADIGDYARFGMEMGGSPVAGTADFIVDAVNLIPGVQIPKLPKYQNDLAQSLRELSSIIIPNVFIAGRLVKAGQVANAAVKWKAGQSALVKFLGTAGVGAGVGAAVDYTVEFNQKDDNFLGSVKKMFPKTLQWISDDWATVDSDSPDLKRAKNIKEGVGLGIFTDLLGGFIKLLSDIKGTRRVTNIIPEDELAKNQAAKRKRAEEASPEDVFDNSAKARESAVDEMANLNLSQAEEAELDQVFGAKDSFDPAEEGLRSMDADGVEGVTVDAVRTQKNINSVYGRLGSILTDAALKYGLKIDNLSQRQVIMMLKDKIKSAGKYAAEIAGGAKITFEMIDEAGTRLAELLYDPRMDTGSLRKTLDAFKDELDKIDGKAKSLSDVGYNATMKAIKSYMDDYIDMDIYKAAGYLTHSLGGQVSDMAEGARLMEGTEAVQRAQEMILDRLEYLMVEKGFAAYNRGASLNFLNTWKRLSKNPGELKDAVLAARQGNEDYLSNLTTNTKEFMDTLRTMSRERPQFLVPLQMAWEFSDGDINTLTKLNRFFDQSLPAISKAFYDDTPEVPNQIVQGAWSNIYNSVLTSISTPTKALFGNLSLMMLKPFSVSAGAVIGRDWDTLKRGWYQYSGLLHTMRNSYNHMSMVFRKASTDPTSVSYIMRDDLVTKNEATMDILHSYARAAEQKGEYGPLALYNVAETLHDLGNNPLLRFGANAMTALDGFTRAAMATVEARGKVYDRFVKGGQKLNGQTLRKAEDDLYNSMFDKSGMITNEAVDYASREIALNLDNEGVQAISKFISHHQYMKPFLMFPRTSANMISMTNKFSPVSLFMKDYERLARPGNNFTMEEIKDILTSKGIEYSGDLDTDMIQFNNLRAEIRGRKAIGTLTIMGAVGLFMNDSLHGNGHFDKERQRVRQSLNWKPRTYKAIDGNWYSYDGMGPISDFLALTADVMDHFDTVTEQDLETTLAKLGFLLGANLTNKSMLAGLEPMNDVLSGNPAALNRWAASFTSSLVPLSGFRNELGRIISPQLREVDQEFFQLLRNRNKFLDAIDPATALPNAYDWIDGNKIGYSDNFFARGWNAIMPMKVSGEISPERQFLIDIEFDSRPVFNKSEKGIKLTPKQRSELYSLIGQQHFFRDSIREIMQTTDAKEWRAQIKEMRRSGKQVDPELWQSLYRRLNSKLRQAKKYAMAKMEYPNDIRNQEIMSGFNRQSQLRGQVPQFPLVNR